MEYHKKEAIAYCRTCGKSLLSHSLNDLLLGRRFICPEWAVDCAHIGVVIKKDEYGMHGWLYFQRFLVWFSSNGGLMGRLFAWLPYVQKSAVAILFIGAASLGFALRYLASPHGGLGNCFALMIAGLYILDTLLYNTSVAFVSQLPRLPLRTVILMGIAFLELSFAFAVLYLCLPKGEITLPDPIGPNGDLSSLSAWYFSLVTIVTLGYGDIHPCLNSPRALGLNMWEIISGLYFLSILFAVMVGWANQSSTLLTLSEIVDESERLDKKMNHSRELVQQLQPKKEPEA